MQITRTFDLLQQYQERFIDKDDALAVNVKGQWIKYSSRQYIEYSNYISYGLLASGIKKGDKIATISNNRPEWNFVDMGMAQIGVIHVPVFTSLDQEGYKTLFTHAEVKYVFISDKNLANRINPFLTEISKLEKIFSFDKIEGIAYWKEIVELGKRHVGKYNTELEKIKNGIKTTDCATLIYTSGTTGTSKGVMLSHQNLISNAKAVAGVFMLKSHHKYLSVLPLCHVGERMANYQTQYSGCSIYYAENVNTIARDLQEIKPDGFGAVPRLLEKVYDKILHKGQALTGIKHSLFFWALNLGLKFEIGNKNGFVYVLQLKAANFMIFKKWRQALGGNVKFIGVGGAALSPKLEKVFWAAGIKLLNMYGLTETSPVITMNRSTPPLLKLGTVGALIINVQFKIADDGEIKTRRPLRMQSTPMDGFIQVTLEYCLTVNS